MKTALQFCTTTLLISITFNVYAAQADTGSRVKNYQAPGNLEAIHDIGCISAEQAKHEYLPTDLYRAMTKCVNTGNYDAGVFLFAMAGVYGRYDSLRVADKTAHQAVAVVRMQALNSLDRNRQNAFRSQLKNILRTPDRLAETCNQIQKVGPPDYYPRYMIQHGMGAFLKKQPGDELVKNFDARAAWIKSLDSYLHCPGLQGKKRP